MTFKEALQQYFTGDMELTQVQSVLIAYLESDADAAWNSLTLIDEIRGKGWLSPDIHNELRRTITETPFSRWPQNNHANSKISELPRDIPASHSPDATRLNSRVRSVPSYQAAQPIPALLQAGDDPGLSAVPSYPTGTTGSPSNWTGAPATWTGGAAASAPLGIGSMIAGQYVLKEEIGRGGMGVVYKALDIKAEAARDRFPYVAIKLLSEEFKKHPESLTQLQREAKKSQSLSHPNIVNVFVFNFDEQNAWIVMEYLDGYTLNKLKRRVSHDDAFFIIRQIADALEHAHGKAPNPIVHYDLKPENIFLTKNGSVKLLDFGIARVIPGGDESAGEKTVFDAGTLGALTPSYASCEMLRGFDPDPRDDIYALACIAYELLRGKHPYNRRSAIDAQAQNLRPPAIDGLKRRQHKALQKALAFERTNRTKSVRRFMREIAPAESNSSKKRVLGAIGILTVIILGGSVFWAPRVTEELRIFNISRSMASQNDTEIAKTTEAIKKMSKDDQSTILSNGDNAARILEFYSARIALEFDPASRAYNYPNALIHAQELQRILPNSVRAQQLATTLNQSRKDELQYQSVRRDNALKRNILIPEDGSESLTGIISTIRMIDPRDPSVSDEEVSIQYAQAADLALQRRNTKRAENLISAGISLINDKSSIGQLLAVQNRIDQLHNGEIDADEKAQAEKFANDLGLEKRRQTSQKNTEAEAVRQEIDKRLSKEGFSLMDVGWSVDALTQLKDLGVETNAQRQKIIRRILSSANSMLRSGLLEDAYNIGKYADAFFVGEQEIQDLNTKIDFAIRESRSSNGPAPKLPRSAGATVSTRQKFEYDLEILLSEQDLDDPTTKARIRAHLRTMEREGISIDQTYQRIADEYHSRADSFRQEGDFVKAEVYQTIGGTYAEKQQSESAKGLGLNTTPPANTTRGREPEKLVNPDILVSRFKSALASHQVEPAARDLEQLQALLPASHPFLRQAPEMLIDAYISLSVKSMQDQDLTSALEYLDKALELSPGSSKILRYQNRFKRLSGASDQIIN